MARSSNRKKTSKPVLRDGDLRKFAVETAQGLIGVMKDNASRILEGDDPIHDMRVASRRLRECLQLFKEFFPQKGMKRAQSRIKKVTRVLGTPREMDVNVQLLRKRRPGPSQLVQATQEHLIEIFEFEQARRRRKMLRRFDRLDVTALQDELLDFVGNSIAHIPRPGLLGQPTAEFAMDRFRQTARSILQEKIAPLVAFQTALPQPQSDDELHRLRIAVKKCRYCLELLSPAFDRSFDKAIASAKELQEVLGTIHDHVALIQSLQSYQHHLTEKNRARLMQGCERIVTDLGRRKESYLPQVEPALKKLLNELPSLSYPPLPPS
ncbi:MAG: CHAD domain-containing protein [Acidobacteriota bacterium]